MGQIRDLVHAWPQDGAQRIIAGNTTLKQRVRHFTRENRVLEERLQAGSLIPSPARSPDRRGCREAMRRVRVAVMRS